LATIKRAIISVYDKTGIEALARFLNDRGIQIISSGGTRKVLEKAEIKTQQISDITGFPEILDGRVKTLHPVIFAGILAKRSENHLKQLSEQNIDPVDLVIVNLYPFEETVARKNCSLEEAVENIDIGGPSLIRAAAKNFDWTTVITSPDQYDDLMNEIERNESDPSLSFRRRCAVRAFEHTARYNALISDYLKNEGENAEEFSEEFTLAGRKISDLRYGENPHQKAAYFSFSDKNPLSNFKQLHGKELSYNNLIDLDAALSIVKEFDENLVVIIKHTNPCGAARGDTLSEAYQLALNTDSLSAFGGIVGLSGSVDKDLAEKMSEHFFECILAPGFSEEALSILSRKKNLRLISFNPDENDDFKYQVRAISGGILLQSKDKVHLDVLQAKVVTKRPPTESEWKALAFSWKLVKHVHSNAIIYTTDRQLIGVGAGQMSRIDAAELAVKKAEQAGHSTRQTVCASDAFFPFKDGIEALAKAGITAVIQPGGSIRDAEVIETADEHNLAMVLTGMRHFKH
jgi:phosphoribosylaminoimidazolecarboxamide formyltransferase/IMP cyclohydrolase